MGLITWLLLFTRNEKTLKLLLIFFISVVIPGSIILAFINKWFYSDYLCLELIAVIFALTLMIGIVYYIKRSQKE